MSSHRHPPPPASSLVDRSIDATTTAATTSSTTVAATTTTTTTDGRGGGGARSRARVREEVASRWSERRRAKAAEAAEAAEGASSSGRPATATDGGDGDANTADKFTSAAAAAPSAAGSGPVTGHHGQRASEESPRRPRRRTRRREEEGASTAHAQYGPPTTSQPLPPSSPFNICRTVRYAVGSALRRILPVDDDGEESSSTSARDKRNEGNEKDGSDDDDGGDASSYPHPSSRRRLASPSTRAALSNSVLRLQSAAAVAAEVETMTVRRRRRRRSHHQHLSVDETTADDDQDRCELTDENNDSSASASASASTEEEESVISVLPRGYDQFPSALSLTSTTRTRAFHLLDLASVISSHRTFHALTAGAGVYSRSRSIGEMKRITERKGGSVYVSPQFCVTKNRDLELLRLLVRLGVGLRCAGSEDVEAARRAVEMERTGGRGGGGLDYHDGEEEREEEKYGGMIDDDGVMDIVDDAGRCRKPDGYFRRLLFPSKPCERTGGEATAARGNGSTMHTSSRPWPDLAVDDPDEVRRISRAVRRFASRAAAAGAADTDVDGGGGRRRRCRFVLRLPSLSGVANSASSAAAKDEDSDDASTANAATRQWDDLLVMAFDAAQEEGGHLVGVSVDLSPWANHLDDDHHHQSSCTAAAPGKREKDVDSNLRTICHRLRRVRILLHLFGVDQMRIDLTGLPYPLTRELAERMTGALAGVVGRAISRDEARAVCGENGAGCFRDTSGGGGGASLNGTVLYTADVSNHLVANAGALCTRIIGVKRDEGRVPKDGREGTDDETSVAAITTHYYIDDGCYGSLSSTGASSLEVGQGCKGNACSSSNVISSSASRGFSPLPLYGNGAQPSSTADTELPSTGPTSLVRATVWGPTCDGLDRVCESVDLPNDLEANRDWLVFPNLGCGGFGGGLGLGTAFNGFDPPDTAYCVLGYFSGGG